MGEERGDDPVDLEDLYRTRVTLRECKRDSVHSWHRVRGVICANPLLGSEGKFQLSPGD